MVTKNNVVTETEIAKIPAKIEQQLLGIEMLPVSDLFIDSDYQRDLDAARTVKMAKEWNWLACGSLTVSLRQGEDGKNTYAVLDGQQRLNSIRLLNYKEAPCRIYIDLDKDQEAELFELLNKSKKPGYNADFKSRLSRGEHVAKVVNTAVEQIGYHLDPERRHAGDQAKDTHFYIQTMVELERIYKTGGVTLIMDTLRLIRDVWAPEYLQQQQMTLSGTALFLKRYPSVRLTELKEKLRREGQMKMVQRALQYSAVHGKATGGSSRGNAYAEAMLIVYNANRQEGNRIKSKA